MSWSVCSFRWCGIITSGAQFSLRSRIDLPGRPLSCSCSVRVYPAANPCPTRLPGRAPRPPHRRAVCRHRRARRGRGADAAAVLPALGAAAPHRRAGHPRRRPHRRRHTASRHRARASPRPSRPPPLRLPRGYAWVVRLVPGTAAYGTQLQALLAEPEMACLAEAPSMRRLLNPLRQMLGLPKPPPRPSPRPAAATPRPGTPDQGSDRKPAGIAPPQPASPVAA